MFREMRRFKQQITTEECKKVLKEEKRAAFSVIGDDGYPYTIPINFYYDEADNIIYFHGAKEGHKVDAMNRCDKVCLTVWNQGFKKEGHWEWNPTSVVVFGKVKLVTEKNIFEDRLRKLAAKYYPNIDEIEKEMEVYYFSPTGGTKKVSSIFADAMEKEVIWHDLGSKEPMMEKPEGEMTVVASPVFGGRIPSVVREKIEKFSGTGKKAVTIAVYGNRAYEDALLEMNDILTKCGFTVIASGAFVAQHSMAPEVGAGRPDGEDEKEIHKFAETVKNSTAVENVQVPGNRPYKPEMNMPVAPISLPSCTKCGKCVTVCPTNAISVADGAVITDIEKCILCMACTHICTEQARIRPLPLQQKTEQMLGALKGVRNKNEVFL
ncbi:MAG: pyridoxamine 5'-phosphate oxidase family protein [Clostridium sp.]